MPEQLPTPRYCQVCGHYLVERYVEREGQRRLTCEGCGFVHYMNPRVVVAVIVERDRHVLLQQRAIEPRRGYWTFPGGFLEIGELPADGAVRETKEEVGLEVALTGLALDLLFPPQCAVCRTGGSVLCDLCVARLPLAEQPRCDRCWDDVRSGSRCERCATAPPAFAAVRSPFVHANAARELVHLLKYDGLTSLAAPMAGLMLEAARMSATDVIVPVPLHGGRQRSRGYNQAALLASRIAAGTGWPLDERAVRRVRATKPLARSMSREERAAIVAGAFRADPSRVDGRTILLVDDVVTTGATLDSCARALLEAGARRVDAVTFVHA